MTDFIPEVPFALVSSPYLEQIIADIEKTTIPWKEYKCRGLVTGDQVELINAIDKQPPDHVHSVMEHAGMAGHASFGYRWLCCYGFGTHVDEENIRYFHDMVKQGEQYPFGPFIKILQTKDEKTALVASKPLITLLCSAPNPASLDIEAFCRWLSEKISSRRPEYTDLAVQETESLLQVREFRIPFWNTNNAVEGLVLDLSLPTITPQMQYQITFCLWLLTFEHEIATKINSKYDIIPKLICIAKNSFKEKVIRVSIATLRNLVANAPAENLASMLVENLLPFTENLCGRKWSDPDIVEDIEYLKEHLQEKFQSLTTFEKYASEVETGKLEWSPPHKSEMFWRDNVNKLEGNDFQIIRELARIISSSTDPRVLAIATSDLGHYVKYASKKGREVLLEVGAKHRIMELMSHSDPDVRYQALNATQRYMHQAW